MYKFFYQMKEEAFSIIPSLNLFFDSETHKTGWQFLTECIKSDEQFISILGDFGMGKTLLCLKLQDYLKIEKKLHYVSISNPNLSYMEFLNHIKETLNITVKENENISDKICKHIQNKLNFLAFYIIIDDAQILDIKVLEKILYFLNFNYNNFFPFRIIFFSHPSFLDNLKNPLLKPLEQRVRKKFYLQKLNYQDLKEYIYYRLFKSDAPGIPVFTEGAFKSIYKLTNGVPRLINNICDSCLSIGASKNITTITESIVNKTNHNSNSNKFLFVLVVIIIFFLSSLYLWWSDLLPNKIVIKKEEAKKEIKKEDSNIVVIDINKPFNVLDMNYLSEEKK